MLMKWADNQCPSASEIPERFAERLMDRRKPDGYVRHFGSEFCVLQKWAARYLHDSKPVPMAEGVPASAVATYDDPLPRTVIRQVVFRLMHHKIVSGQSPDPDDPNDDPKEIGLYSSIDKAQAAIEQLRPDEGFRDWPDGFRIYSFPLDDTGWLGGYGPDPYLDPKPE